MLKTAWSKVVHSYQTARQAIDENELAVIDKRIKEAEKGYQTYMGPAPIWGPTYMTGRIELKPEEVPAVIAENQQERARVVEAMKARREKYGIKP
jgi:hypothetical protein